MREDDRRIMNTAHGCREASASATGHAGWARALEGLASARKAELGCSLVLVGVGRV